MPREQQDDRRLRSGKGGAMIRIANGSAFWGDSSEAPLQLLRGGPLDYLTLDYLAEITMSILQKQRARDPRAGFAHDFAGLIKRGAREIVEGGVKVVANAGGINPEGCRQAVVAALQSSGYGGRVKVGADRLAATFRIDASGIGNNFHTAL